MWNSTEWHVQQESYTKGRGQGSERRLCALVAAWTCSSHGGHGKRRRATRCVPCRGENKSPATCPQDKSWTHVALPLQSLQSPVGIGIHHLFPAGRRKCPCRRPQAVVQPHCKRSIKDFVATGFEPSTLCGRPLVGTEQWGPNDSLCDPRNVAIRDGACGQEVRGPQRSPRGSGRDWILCYRSFSTGRGASCVVLDTRSGEDAGQGALDTRSGQGKDAMRSRGARNPTRIKASPFDFIAPATRGGKRGWAARLEGAAAAAAANGKGQRVGQR